MCCTAQFIGGDPDKDIAVLKLEAPEEKLKELKPVQLGTSTNLQVGQKVGSLTKCAFFVLGFWVRNNGVPEDQYDFRTLSLQVYAIGNPFGLDHTLTQVCIPEQHAHHRFQPV
jgi:S1-C subfamily serine protease